MVMAAPMGLILLFAVIFLHEYSANAMIRKLGSIMKGKEKKRDQGTTEKPEKIFSDTCEYLGLEIRAAICTIRNTRTDEHGQPKQPEDRYSTASRNGRIGFAVFDGHDGKEVAEHAEQALLPYLLERMEEAERNGVPIPTAIQQTIRAFDADIIDCEFPSGSTATIAVLDGNQLYIANLGDSRTTLKRKGKVWATVDHSTNTQSEIDRINGSGLGVVQLDENGWKRVWMINHDNGERKEWLGHMGVTRALGDRNFKPVVVSSEAEVEVINWQVENVGYLVLATDGLWDTVKSKDALIKVDKWIRKPYFGADELVKKARKDGSIDDITVIVVNLMTAATSTSA